MKIEKLRQLSPDELRVREGELTEEIFRLRLRRATAQLTNPTKLRESRRTLARVKTLLQEERAKAAQGESAR